MQCEALFGICQKWSKYQRTFFKLILTNLRGKEKERKISVWE